MTMAAEMGIYIFPGMPNGTEIGQECDQLFSLVKTQLYNNRDYLWEALYTIAGEEKAELKISDFGYILFGGNVYLPDGSTLSLTNSFADSLQPHHVKSARKACGYCPATRSALESNKLRHEIVEMIDGEIDSDADPYGSLINLIEETNIHVCAQLIDAGYSEEAVVTLQRFARRVTGRQVQTREATRTDAGSRERQDLLAKCTTAGQFFWITRGGAIMNSSDVLLSFERKEMEQKVKKMKQHKDDCGSFVNIKSDYDELMQTKIAPENWKNDELKVYIR
jgi:hypothetical protein